MVDFEMFFLFFPENRLWHDMQIISEEDNLGDNLPELSVYFSLFLPVSRLWRVMQIVS